MRRYIRNSKSALRSSTPSAVTNNIWPATPTPQYGVEPRVGEHCGVFGETGGDAQRVARPYELVRDRAAGGDELCALHALREIARMVTAHPADA